MTTEMIGYRCLNYTRGNSYKFWHILLWEDATVETRYGRIGTQGQTQVKRFGNMHEASQDFYARVDQKINKGYYDDPENPTPTAWLAPPSVKPKETREQLVQSLVELLND